VSGAAPSPYDGFDAMPIADQWRGGRSGDTGTNINPWNGDVLTEIPLADRNDLDIAYSAAQRAQPRWAARPPAERARVMQEAARILEARHDEVTGWLGREAGGTVAKAELEWDLVRGVLWEAAAMPHHLRGTITPSDIPGKDNLVYRQPAGVVAVISPWNFPFQLSARSVAPALAVGNAVVLKPASDTPVTGGLLLAKILAEAGLPEGLLSVVVGAGHEIGDAIVSHPVPQVVSFTGSSGVGEGITQKAGIKKLALELGGNGPLVVLDDADLELAVNAAVFGAFFHQGQICMRANRIIVDRTRHDEFTGRFTERVRALRTGDPADPDTEIGPVINQRQLEGIQDKVDRAVKQGATTVVGGDPGGPNGLLLPPHVLLGGNDVATAQEEVFGPVITVIPADGDADALAIANDTEYGLSSAVITRDRDRGVQFALGIEAGMTHVNDSPVNDDPNTAFGGVKASGIGRFGDAWAIDEFTVEHWISVQRSARQYPI
jgi:aldehyde dehydrogenase (NAD+)